MVVTEKHIIPKLERNLISVYYPLKCGDSIYMPKNSFKVKILYFPT